MAGFEDLGSNETILRGSWVQEGTAVRADRVCDRIEWLVGSRLQQTAVDASGWTRLFRDPRDGRLWELTYLKSEMHGGGPPVLVTITNAEAQLRYAPGTG